MNLYTIHYNIACPSDFDVGVRFPRSMQVVAQDENEATQIAIDHLDHTDYKYTLSRPILDSEDIEIRGVTVWRKEP